MGSKSPFSWLTSFPKFRWVLFWWGVFFASLFVGNLARAGQTSTAAVQLKDKTDTVTHRFWINNDVPGYVSVAILAVACFLLLKWAVHAGIALYKQRQGSSAPTVMIVAIVGFTASGCGDPLVEKFEEIGPSETAFVIPLEGETSGGQAKFDSADMLEKQRVATKRVSLNQRKKSTGRLWSDYEWIPTDRVLRVDRAQVSREWTAGTTPNSPTSEGFHVESLDSIGFSVGGALLCHIEEADAAKHLYHFGGKSLKEVMDGPMRTWLLGQLTQHFSAFNLTECIKRKVEFLKDVEATAKTYWKERGITVDSFTMSEGITYDNDKVQETLDAKFVAENDLEVQKKLNLSQSEKNLVEISKQTGLADAAAAALKAKAENDKAIAEAEKAAQVVRNEIDVSKAETAAKVAALYAQAKEGIAVQVDADVRRIMAEAYKVAAATWKGQLPASILPAGSPLLFGLDQPKTPTAPSVEK